jgi:hypothetical protein
MRYEPTNGIGVMIGVLNRLYDPVVAKQKVVLVGDGLQNGDDAPRSQLPNVEERSSRATGALFSNLKVSKPSATAISVSTGIGFPVVSLRALNPDWHIGCAKRFQLGADALVPH